MVFQGLTCLTGSRGQAVMLGLFPLFKTGLEKDSPEAVGAEEYAPKMCTEHPREGTSNKIGSIDFQVLGLGSC